MRLQLRTTATNCLMLILMLSVLPVLAEEKPLALGGLDPVALLQGEESLGKEDLVGSDEHYRYLFKSEENLAEFTANKKALGIQNEMCPVAPGERVNASIFTVHDGRLYAFATSGCIDHFRSSPEFFLSNLN